MSYFWHKNCKWKMKNAKGEGRREQRQKEQEIVETQVVKKRETRKSTDSTIHNKNLCIWCMQGK